jgi:hypothetical protein
MVEKTSKYYTQFTSTVSAGALRKWTKDMESAESRRLLDPTTMDIMGPHKDIEADPGQSGLEPSHLSSVGTQWLNLALSIEERQYVSQWQIDLPAEIDVPQD